MQALYIDTPNGRIYGQAAGNPKSTLVVGLHGWSQRNGWHTWKPLIEPLAEAGYYVVSVDMPGWGQSDSWGPAPLTMAKGVEAVLAIIDGLGKESTVLMGKSWGGGVALQSALAYADRVTSLILTAPAFRNIQDLKGLSQAVLLAWAKDDPVIPYKYAAEYVAAIGDIQLVTYPTGGHSAAPKNARAFAPLAAEFLERST